LIFDGAIAEDGGFAVDGQDLVHVSSAAVVESAHEVRVFELVEDAADAFWGGAGELRECVKVGDDDLHLSLVTDFEAHGEVDGEGAMESAKVVNDGRIHEHGWTSGRGAIPAARLNSSSVRQCWPWKIHSP
jgi:hypothetical protein